MSKKDVSIDGRSCLSWRKRNYPHRVRLIFDPKDSNSVSMTQQHVSHDTDINFIMSRFQATGVIEHVNSKIAQFGDFSDVTDYHSAMNMVCTVQDNFMMLPPEIRARFKNDAGAYLEFALDPSNKDEIAALGRSKVAQEPSQSVDSKIETQNTPEGGKPA